MAEQEKPDNRTASQKRRAEYQEQQREYLRGLGLMQQIQADIDSVTNENLPVVKFKTETRIKLLGKILPEVKESALELSGPDGGPIQTERTIKFVDGDGATEKA
jgi:hypothetical protein